VRSKIIENCGNKGKEKFRGSYQCEKGRPSRWFAAFRQHAHIFRRFKQALEEVDIKRNEKAEERE